MTRFRLSSLKGQFTLKLIRFFAVGVGATAIYYLSGFAALKIGFSMVVAHLIAFVVSQVASYSGQTIYTFEIRDDHKRAGSRYVVAVGVISISQLTLVVALTQLGLGNNAVLTISTLCHPPMSFFIHNVWTFRKN